jgi:hypothetical protein
MSLGLDFGQRMPASIAAHESALLADDNSERAEISWRELRCFQSTARQ